MERLRVVFAGEGDDVVLAEGVSAQVCQLADPAVLEIEVGAQRADRTRLVPMADDPFGLALGGLAARRGAWMAPARQLVGAPVGRRLALLVEELDQHLGDADVRPRSQIALLLDR